MKKGFTLIEIIVCIGVLAVIGVSSFFGIRLILKNIRINNLEQITDKAIEAAQVYIETNKEAYKNLYEKQNGVIIPLKVLVNEGLLDISATQLDDEDIENEYVVTALTKNSPGDTDCIDLKTVTSWNETTDQKIYLCNDKSTGSNSIIVGDSITNNAVISKTRKYIDSADNYISYKNKTYRLMFIEKDDSLVLYTPEDTFGDEFIGITQETTSDENTNISKTSFPNETIEAIQAGEIYEVNGKNSEKVSDEKRNDLLMYFNKGLIVASNGFPVEVILHKELKKENKEQYVSIEDLHFINNKLDQSNRINSFLTLHYYYYYWLNTYGSFTTGGNVLYIPGKKIRLKTCMKIDGGLGTIYDPYKITDKYC